MRDQLSQLVDFATWPNITVRVLPFNRGAYPGMGSPFDLLGFPEAHNDDIAYVENLRHGLLLEEPATVATYRTYFAGLCEAALDEGDSIQLIAHAAR